MTQIPSKVRGGSNSQSQNLPTKTARFHHVPEFSREIVEKSNELKHHDSPPRTSSPKSEAGTSIAFSSKSKTALLTWEMLIPQPFKKISIFWLRCILRHWATVFFLLSFTSAVVSLSSFRLKKKFVRTPTSNFTRSVLDARSSSSLASSDTFAEAFKSWTILSNMEPAKRLPSTLVQWNFFPTMSLGGAGPGSISGKADLPLPLPFAAPLGGALPLAGASVLVSGFVWSTCAASPPPPPFDGGGPGPFLPFPLAFAGAGVAFSPSRAAWSVCSTDSAFSLAGSAATSLAALAGGGPGPFLPFAFPFAGAGAGVAFSSSAAGAVCSADSAVSLAGSAATSLAALAGGGPGPFLPFAFPFAGAGAGVAFSSSAAGAVCSADSAVSLAGFAATSLAALAGGGPGPFFPLLFPLLGWLALKESDVEDSTSKLCTGLAGLVFCSSSLSICFFASSSWSRSVSSSLNASSLLDSLGPFKEATSLSSSCFSFVKKSIFSSSSVFCSHWAPYWSKTSS